MVVIPCETQGIRRRWKASRIAIEKLDAKIDKSVLDLKSELIRWMVSVGILQMALIAGLVLKLAH